MRRSGFLLIAMSLVFVFGTLKVYSQDTATQKPAAQKEAKAPGEKAPEKQQATPDTTKKNEPTEEKAVVEMPPTLHPKVEMNTTLGKIVLELDAENAPVSVNNFLQYAKDGFYNGTIFHRVMKTFMIQGGGFSVDMEKKSGLRGGIKNEWKNGLKNSRGTISMARLGGDADSATAQFFINVVDNAGLDVPRDGAGYAVFGKVVEGMDVVDKIRNTPVEKHPKYSSPQAVTPVVPVVITSVKLLSNYDMEKVSQSLKEKEEMAKASADKQIQLTIRDVEGKTGNPVLKTESGLMYSIIKEGEGDTPQKTDRVTVHYTGTLLDGSKFDSSYDRNKPLTIGLNEVIPGWTEGVSMMKVGGKRYLIVPPDLGYGNRPIAGIPPGSTLVFEVELLGIE